MRFALTEDQVALRDGVRDVLTSECTPDVVRAAWPGGDRARVDAVWRTLTEVGVAGAAVPEADGGLGLDDSDLVPLLEETGRAGLPLPAVETVAVAGPLLAATGDPGGLLASVVAGDTLVACELTGGDLVPYAQVAGAFLLGDERGVRLLRPDEVGVEPLETVDGARQLGRVTAAAGAGVQVTDDAELVRLAVARGTVGTAAQLSGLAARMIDMTVDYVKTREQFGVPIGSFQAVKHHLANALLRQRFARPAVLRAGYSLAGGGADRWRDVSAAKAMTSEAARAVAGLCIQCHGAIAYTTEYDLHLFAKRAWALAESWGGAEEHRRRIAETLGL